MATNNRKIQVYLKEKVDEALETFKKSKRIETDSQAVNRALSLFFKLEEDDPEYFPLDESKFVTTGDYLENTTKLQSQIDMLQQRLSILEERLSETNGDSTVTISNYQEVEKLPETTIDSLDKEQLPKTTGESPTEQELPETPSKPLLDSNSQETTSDDIKEQELLETTSESKLEREKEETISNSIVTTNTSPFSGDSNEITSESPVPEVLSEPWGDLEDNSESTVTTSKSEKGIQEEKLVETTSEPEVITKTTKKVEELPKTISDSPKNSESTVTTSESVTVSPEGELPETPSNYIKEIDPTETLGETKVTKESQKDNQLPETTSNSIDPTEHQQLSVTTNESPKNNQPKDPETDLVEEEDTTVGASWKGFKEALDEIDSPEQEAFPFDPNDEENVLEPPLIEVEIAGQSEEQPLPTVNNDILKEAIKQWSKNPRSMKATSALYEVKINTEILIEHLGAEEYARILKTKYYGGDKTSIQLDAINHWLNTSDNFIRTKELFKVDLSKKIILDYLRHLKIGKNREEIEDQYNSILAAKPSKPSTLIEKK